MRFSTMIMAASILFTPMRSLQSQGLVNGSFDAFVPSNDAGGGWASANLDFAGGHRTSGGNPDGFFILNESGNPGTDPTLSQVVSELTAGLSYAVSGDFRTVYVGQDTGGTMAFGVAIDGSYRFESAGITDTGWRSFSFNFVAPASSVTLSLAGERNETDNDFGVDNIALTAIPEPGVLALLAAGGAMVLARRRTMRPGTSWWRKY